MEKKIAVCIGTDRDNGVRVRLSLMRVEGEEVVTEQYHSFMVLPGQDPEEIRAGVQQHLAAPKSGIPGGPWPAIPQGEWRKVLGCIAVLHAP